MIKNLPQKGCTLTYSRTIDGIKVLMYERESHGPPHVHVWCNKEVKGLIAIESLEVISDARLPSSCLKPVIQWMKERQDELMTFWREARERQRQGGNKP